MSNQPKAPKTFDDFVARYPALGEAWSTVHEASKSSRFDDKQSRLLKLAIAIGAQREGAVRASARKAAAMGIDDEEIYDVVALSVSSLGFPACVAAFSWVRDSLDSTG